MANRVVLNTLRCTSSMRNIRQFTVGPPLFKESILKDNSIVKGFRALRERFQRKSEMETAGKDLYIQYATADQFYEFLKELKFEDTFYTWFLVTELHMWMLSKRLAHEGQLGNMLAEYLIARMWEDINYRSKLIGARGLERRRTLKIFNGQIQAAFMAYDEGLSDDKKLAGAILTLFNFRQCEPIALEALVEYVRKNNAYLESISFKTFHEQGASKFITWQPLRVSRTLKLKV